MRRKMPPFRRPLPGLTLLLVAVALAGCGDNVSQPRSSGSTGSGCLFDCYDPGPVYQFPTPSFRTTPAPVAGGQTFTTIAAGWEHACALTPAGNAQCWGELLSAMGEFGSVSVPESVGGGTAFYSLSAGAAFTCGIAADARALCWGRNAEGELGSSTMGASAFVPTPVSGAHAFVSISPGVGFISAGAHACAVDAAGAAYCWGNNAFGQLGAGDSSNATAPVAVAGGHTFTSLASGNAFTCGLTTTGAAYCWGLGESGALGVGAAPLGSCLGQFAGNGATLITEPCSRTPVAVAGGLAFTAIAAGMRHVCGLANGGAAYCWGMTGWGNYNEPVAVVGGDARFTRIAAGGTSSCALTADGEAYCWGENKYGQVGDGTTFDRGPTRVATSLRFVDISVGHDFACAVTSDGAAYCWGSDEHGKLGDGA